MGLTRVSRLRSYGLSDAPQLATLRASTTRDDSQAASLRIASEQSVHSRNRRLNRADVGAEVFAVAGGVLVGTGG